MGSLSTLMVIENIFVAAMKNFISIESDCTFQKRIAYALAWLSFCSLSLLSTQAFAVPFTPASGDTVLEHLPTKTDPVQRELSRLRSELTAQPDNLMLATTLAKRYINAARSDGDPRYLGYAQAALKPWWSMAHPPIPVLVIRATLRQSTHQFPLALEDINAVLKQDRDNAQAWITRATVLQVQGQYAMAKESCMHLYSIAPELIAQTCLSNAQSLNGELATSYHTLATAYSSARSIDNGIRIWMLTLLAEMAERRGDVLSAEKWFKQALALESPDSYLLGAYADFLLDQQRSTEVLDLLKNQTRVDALLLRYALALQAQNSAEAAVQIRTLDQRFDAAKMRGDTVHQREEARFQLSLKNQPKTALVLAQRNWQIQKEIPDARILLESALADHHSQSVADVMAWLEKNRVEDVHLAALMKQLRAEK